MIESRLPRARPRLLAVYSYRFDAHLVPALHDNIAPLVDGWIGYDDRGATGEFSDEPARRFMLLSAAREAGAEWVLAIDPDERVETRARRRLRHLLDGKPSAYTLRFRELYGPDHYRVDGLWGRKSQARLLRVADGVVPPRRDGLHTSWHELIPRTEPRRSGINLYHLKMIEPARRRARAELYTRLDPERRMQRIGYDYLADESGLRLRRIPVGRGYHPAHVDDGGLWMSAGNDEGGPA